MARLIVKQPNGLYACWSTIIDDFIFTDADKNDYIETRSQEAYMEKKEELCEIFDSIERGCTRYTKDYNECLEIKKRLYGEIDE